MAVAKNDLDKAVKKILEYQGKNYEEWKKQTVTSAKLEILEGKNKDWENSIISSAQQDFVNEYISTNLVKNANNNMEVQ